MQGRLPGIAESLSAAWAAFLKYPGVLIGIFLVYIVITAGLGAIPGIGTIANFFVMPPLMGGAIVAGMKAVRGQTPEFNDLFVGFRQYWRWVGVYWLFVAILIATMIPLGIGAAIAGVMGGLTNSSNTVGTPTDMTPAGFVALIVTGLISLVLYATFAIRYMFAYFEAADGAEIIDSFKKSEPLTRGIRLTLLGYSIVLGVFSIVGVIACGVGMVLTSLVAYLAIMHIYLALKGEQVQAAA